MKEDGRVCNVFSISVAFQPGGGPGGNGFREQGQGFGAGHGPQNRARVTASGLLFIPSQGGRSHRPDETSDWRAIERGANTLLYTLLGLAGSQPRPL